MTAPADSYQLGLAVEGTYGTYAAPTRFFDTVKRPSLVAKPKIVYGSGQRAGARVASARRRILAGWDISGDTELDLPSVGFGTILAAFFGPAASLEQVGATSAYQQLYKLNTSALDPVSCTLQQTVEQLTGAAGSTTKAQTFLGMQCSQLEISTKGGEVVTAKASWVGRELKTDTAPVAPTYPDVEETLFFAGAALVAGGALTAPTPTDLASLAGGTPLASARDFTATFKKAGKLRDAALGSIKPRGWVNAASDTGTLSGKMTLDYDASTFVDALQAQTPMALVVTFSGLVDIDAGIKATLQLVYPLIELDGNLPTGSDGDNATVAVDFTGLAPDDGTEPFYAVYLSTDTAP